MRAMRRVPITQITTPKAGLFQIYVDDWWAVSKDEEVYFFGDRSSPYASPQCNANEGLARRVNETRVNVTEERFKHCELTGYAETRQLPIVFVPINMSDYLHYL